MAETTVALTGVVVNGVLKPAATGVHGAGHVGRSRDGHEQLRRRGGLAPAVGPLRVERLALVLAAVDQVEGLAPDVGVGLVERAGLVLVDQPGGVLGVGVAPLVRHDVVGGDSVAVVGGHAVPVGVGAVDARVVVDGDPLRAGAVVGVAVEDVLEEPVRLTRGVDQVLLVGVERAREGVALLPHRGEDGGLGGAAGLAELAVEGVGRHRPAVEDLAGLGVVDQLVADRAAVGDLGRVGQDGLADLALDEADAVEDELGVRWP